MPDDQMTYQLVAEEGEVRMVLELGEVTTDFKMSPEVAMTVASDLQETAEEARSKN